MKITRGLAGLATLTVLSLTAAGCSDTEDTGAAGTVAAPVASATPAPAGELLAAVPGAEVPAFTYAVGGACAGVSGVIDAPNKSATSTLDQAIPDVKNATLTLTFFAVGADKPYVKFGFEPKSLSTLIGVPTAWIALDPAKLEDFDESPLTYTGETDPLAAADLIGTSTDVTRSGAGTYTGTLDLTRVADINPMLEPAEVTALGAKAKSVPFEAKVDAESGHLTTMSVRIPAAGQVQGGTCTLTYGGYGTTKALTEPAASTRKQANAAVYEMLNG